MSKRLICIPREDVEFEQTTELKTTLTIRQFRTLKFSSFPKSSEAERTDFPSYKSSWGVSPNLSKLAKAQIDVDDPKVIADYIVGTRGSINGIYLEKLERYLSLDEARDEKFISEEEYIQLTNRALSSGIFAKFNDDFTSGKLIPPTEVTDFVDDSRFETSINSTIGFPPNKKSTNAMLTLAKLSPSQALKIFEAQWLTGGIIDPATGVKLGLKNAVDDGIISEIYADELRHNLVGPWCRGFSESYSDMLNSNEKHVCWRMVKIENFNVELNFPFLKSQKVGPALDIDDVVLDTLWRKPCQLRNLLPFIELARIQPVLDGLEPISTLEALARPFTHGAPLPIAGYWKQDSGDVISIKQAAKENLITPGLARALLEAQVANGSILDPHDAKNLMDVKEAVEKGFVNPNTQTSLSRAMEIADAEEPTLFDFIKRWKKGQHPHLERLVRLQMACGGLIHPELNFRIPASSFSEYFDDTIIDFVDYCIKDDDIVSYGYHDVNTKENLQYSSLLRRGLIKDGSNLLVYDAEAAQAEPEMLTKEEIMSRLTKNLKKNFTLSDLQDAELLKPKTIDEIRSGKIATFDFDRLVLDPLKIAIRRSRPLVGIKIDNEKIRWPEALERGDISNLVLKDMVNSQIACSEDVDIEKFPQNLQNGFNRTKRIVNGDEIDEDDNPISLLRALERKQMREADALKLIDAQLATGGITDFRHPFRLGLSAAKEKKLLDNPDIWERKIRKAMKNGLFKDLTVDGQRKCSYSLLLENASSDEEHELFLRLPRKNSQPLPVQPSSSSESSLRSTPTASTPTYATVDGPLRLRDLSGSSPRNHEADNLTPGRPKRQRKTLEASVPILTSSLEDSFGDKKDKNRPLLGHRLFVEDSEGNTVRLSDALKDGAITKEKANRLIRDNSK